MFLAVRLRLAGQEHDAAVFVDIVCHGVSLSFACLLSGKAFFGLASSTKAQSLHLFAPLQSLP